MSNSPFPFLADPSDPGRDKTHDPVHRAADGHGGDSATELGSEVGEASDDEVNHRIISSETLARATENLHAQERSAGS